MDAAQATAALPYRITGDGLVLQLRVTPNAGRDAIAGVERRGDSLVLRLRVRAVPDRGKANAAVIALLARALGVPRSSLALIAGETSRNKTVAVVGDPAILIAALETLLAAP